jgi:hypothetical protein
MKHPAIIILNALLNGCELEYEGFTYCMSENNLFGYKVLNDDNEEKMIVIDLSLNWFVKFCEKLDESELVALAASAALKSWRK